MHDAKGCFLSWGFGNSGGAACWPRRNALHFACQIGRGPIKQGEGQEIVWVTCVSDEMDGPEYIAADQLNFLAPFDAFWCYRAATVVNKAY